LGYVAGKRTAVDNLPKGCPCELRTFIREAGKALRREGLLVVDTTGYGEQASAISSPKGYEYANMYEKHYRLPLLTYGKPEKQAKAKPWTPEQLRQLKKR